MIFTNQNQNRIRNLTNFELIFKTLRCSSIVEQIHSMAGESSARFNQQQQGMLLKPGGAMSNSGNGGGVCELIPMGSYYNNNNVGGGMNLGGNERRMIFSSGGGAVNSNNSTATAAGLKHDTGLAAEWSVEEQYKLEEGLAKYCNEPNILRYIKIAGSLRDKTVRDVALRCRWMSRKRRKQEDLSSGKKVKDRKDKLVDSHLKNNTSSSSSVNVAPYSLTKSQNDQSDYMLSGVLSGTARHLLEENNQAFGQISANLSILKLQQNVDLFSRARNNLTTILNDMKNTPGIMSRMPPLPVILNEELASSIFPRSSQPMMFGSSTGIQLKQEPGY